MTTRVLWALLLAFPFGVSAGQIMLKLAAQRIGPQPRLLAVLDPFLLAAVALYGALGVIWLLILKQIPLSTAYPFVAVSFAVTPLLAWLFLADRPAGSYFIGIALICLGVAITQRAAYAG
jgi:undecaprenyl phosphate-alpha-L-ara4N flippase subunit ArnE